MKPRLPKCATCGNPARRAYPVPGFAGSAIECRACHVLRTIRKMEAQREEAHRQEKCLCAHTRQEHCGCAGCECPGFLVPKKLGCTRTTCGTVCTC